jgi:hypothetical protein
MSAPESTRPFDDLSDDALLTRVDVTYVGSNAALAHWLSLVAELDRRRLWAHDGHNGLASWLRWKYRLCRQTSKEKARVARGSRVWPMAFAAFAAGDISYTALRHIVRMPAHDPDTEASLVVLARHAPADDVARVVNGALAMHRDRVGDPAGGHERDGNDDGDGDGDGNGDRDDARDRERAARDPFEQRRFWAAKTFDGFVTGGFLLAPAEGALLRCALDMFLDGRHPGTPRPDTAEGVAAATLFEPTADADTGAPCPDTAEGVAAATPGGASVDPRSIDQRRADAFTEMVCAFLAGGEPDTTGSDRHTLNVLCELDRLLAARDHPGPAAETLDGTPLSAAQLEQLRCDSTLVRVVTNNGRILDIGTRERTIPPALRKKLLLRDRGCRFPGCPHTRWIDAHHITWVRDAGTTDAGNLLLLCGFHHRLIHHDRWTVSGNPDLGAITFHRPDGTPVPHVPTRRAA